MTIVQRLTDFLEILDDPASHRSLGDLQAIRAVSEQEGRISIELCFPFANLGFAHRLPDMVHRQLHNIVGELAIDWHVSCEIPDSGVEQTQPGLKQVKQVVAIASGKGGVGKSTCAVNLALALAAEGARVGLLDADVYGPSIPLMMGLEGRQPEVVNDKQMKPIKQYNVLTNSIGFLIPPDQAAIWRGPMAGAAVEQLLGDTLWGELDVLIMDMPPGTGDIQLSLSQKAKLAGAVMITTPQEIAVADVRKGIAMFDKVQVPILGVLENMAGHRCSQCGHIDPIFGERGGAIVAKENNVPLLGSLPLASMLREQTDAGRPTVKDEPDNDLTWQYRDIAAAMHAQIWQLGQSLPPKPDIEFVDD